MTAYAATLKQAALADLGLAPRPGLEQGEGVGGGGGVPRRPDADLGARVRRRLLPVQLVGPLLRRRALRHPRGGHLRADAGRDRRGGRHHARRTSSAQVDYIFSSDDLYRNGMPDWSYYWGSNAMRAGYGLFLLNAARLGADRLAHRRRLRAARAGLPPLLPRAEPARHGLPHQHGRARRRALVVPALPRLVRRLVALVLAQRLHRQAGLGRRARLPLLQGRRQPRRQRQQGRRSWAAAGHRRRRTQQELLRRRVPARRRRHLQPLLPRLERPDACGPRAPGRSPRTRSATRGRTSRSAPTSSRVGRRPDVRATPSATTACSATAPRPAPPGPARREASPAPASRATKRGTSASPIPATATASATRARAATPVPPSAPRAVGPVAATASASRAVGEDCLSCAADCAGRQSGKTNQRFCCGDGAGSNPVGLRRLALHGGARFECGPTPAGLVLRRRHLLERRRLRSICARRLPRAPASATTSSAAAQRLRRWTLRRRRELLHLPRRLPGQDQRPGQQALLLRQRRGRAAGGERRDLRRPVLIGARRQSGIERQNASRSISSPGIGCRAVDRALRQAHAERRRRRSPGTRRSRGRDRRSSTRRRRTRRRGAASRRDRGARSRARGSRPRDRALPRRARGVRRRARC